MDPQNPTGPRVAGTRKEIPWRRSGTYYLDDATEKKSHCCRIFLLVLLLVPLLTLLFTVAVFYLFQDNPQTEEFKQQCHEDITMNDTLRKYEKHEQHSAVNICKSYQNFASTDGRELPLLRYKTTGNPPSVFDHTSFSEMSPNERVLYAVKKLSLKQGVYNLKSTTEKKYINYFDDFSKTINFDDLRPIEEDIKSALLQYAWYYNEKSYREKYSNASSLLAESHKYHLTVMENMKETLKNKNDDFQKGYLDSEGIFATEIYVDDSFFLYRNGIFPPILCNPGSNKVKVAVIVLGFGAETFDNESYEYWLVQPVGKKFKDWGMNGVAKISDLCYKKNDTPRVIDVTTADQGIQTVFTPFGELGNPQV